MMDDLEKAAHLLRSFRQKQSECQAMSDAEVAKFFHKICSYLNSGDDIPKTARELLGSAVNALGALSGRPDMDEVDMDMLEYKQTLDARAKSA